MSSTAILGYIIISLALGYAFIYPNYGDISLLSEERGKFQASLDQATEIENRKNELLTEFSKISEEEKESIETVLPDELDYTKLISDLDVIAAGHGIIIDKVAKQELDSNVGDSIEDAAPPKPYRSGLISLDFQSSYQRFSDFVLDLEQSLRLLDIRSLKIESTEKGDYNFHLQFEAYWLE